jgi:two-component system phosphate regulon response regulator PhoB
MSKTRILVVEDDEDLQELLKVNLTRENYSVIQARTGVDALRLVKEQRPDLILLDLMLPQLGGLEVCRKLKADEELKHIPLIMVTAKGEEADVVAGLELGADDYVTKPFSPRVLLARVSALLRRKSLEEEGEVEELRVHDIVIHPGRFEVWVSGRPVTLTQTEFRILYHLCRRPGWVFTRYQIVDAVHGEEHDVTERSVDVQIVSLRKKLGRAGRYIETVRGVGYRMKR